MRGGDDAEILRCAVEQSRWLITFDRDYGELVFARNRASPPAIVYLRQEPYPPTRPAELVLALLADPSSADGHFVVVSERSVRRRALPRRTG
jgi:predicted nuclease of predicted toxin-antitoxin system